LNSAELKTSFVELMTVNRAPAGIAGASPGAGVVDFLSNAFAVDKSLLSRIWNGRRLSQLSADEFMSRLGGSEVGDLVRDAIRSAGLADPDQALKDVASRFDQLGREASVFFERRARLVSVLAAMVIAWPMYVHPYELFRTYLDRPEVTEAVIAMQHEVLAKYEEQVKLASDRAAEAAMAASGGNDAARQSLDEAVAARDKAIAAMDAASKSLQAAGVPIGWNQQRLDAAGFGGGDIGIAVLPYPKTWSSLRTVFWLLIGGLLIGLGGPFWYDMVNSLSSIRTILGGPKSVASTGAEAEASPGETARPQTPVDHFHTAAAGRDAALRSEDVEEEPVG
jgi:hypothetical protein